MTKSHALLNALNNASAKPVAQAKRAQATPAESEPAYYKAPSREGKLHVSAWLPPAYKISLRAIQMKFPNTSLQDLFSEALNDMFEKYDVPVVSEDRKPRPQTPRTTKTTRALRNG